MRNLILLVLLFVLVAVNAIECPCEELRCDCSGPKVFLQKKIVVLTHKKLRVAK